MKYLDKYRGFEVYEDSTSFYWIKDGELRGHHYLYLVIDEIDYFLGIMPIT